MIGQPAKLAVCIPTFRRPNLLRDLMLDLTRQTRQLDSLVIVDGDPASGELVSILGAADFSAFRKVIYLPSNHANLPYQRYLGWRAAVGHEWLLYLDDDLRISQTDFVETLVEPLTWPAQEIVGVTAEIIFPNRGNSRFAGALGERRESARADRPRLVALFGGSRKTPAGGLSPSGHRKLPAYRGRDYEHVEWLRGGVMACRRGALTADCFSDSLFAAAHIGCGLGEDTFLSRRLWRTGRLLYAFRARAEHPDNDLPKAYPTDDFRLGYATAFSRRLLSDNYSGSDETRLADRLALLQSYAGNMLLNWTRAMSFRNPHRWSYAWGYTLGAAKGILRKPTARNLTPHIDWRAEADQALSRTLFPRIATVASQ